MFKRRNTETEMTHARTRAMFRNSLDMEPANDRRCDPVGVFLDRFNNSVQGNAGKVARAPDPRDDEDFEPSDLPADPDFGFERQDAIAEKVAADVADGDGWEVDEVRNQQSITRRR
jgi:hypothetical protein